MLNPDVPGAGLEPALLAERGFKSNPDTSLGAVTEGSQSSGVHPSPAASSISATNPATSEPLIPLGTRIKPWGELSAIHYVGGERYYGFVGERGDVSFLPASIFATPAPCCGGAR